MKEFIKIAKEVKTNDAKEFYGSIITIVGIFAAYIFVHYGIYLLGQ